MLESGEETGFLWETNKPTRSHIVGGYTSSNGHSSSETINPGNVGGNIYTSSNGFQATVQTKSSTTFYSQHFIGDPNIGAKSGSNITGSSLIGSHATSTQACWMKGVKWGLFVKLVQIPYQDR